MDNKSKKVLQSGIWYTASILLLRGISIITSPIYTSLLGTSNYGLANLFNKWVEILCVFTGSTFIYCIGRARIDYEKDFDGFLSSLQGLSSSVGLVFLLAAVLGRKWLAPQLGLTEPLLLLMFVYLLLAPTVDYMMKKFQYEYKYKQNILLSVVSTLSTVALSIGLMLLIREENRYVGKILGFALPTIVLGIFFYAAIWKRGKRFVNREYWGYALKICLPMIPHALAIRLLSHVDAVMIERYCSGVDLSVYSYGYTIASLLSIFTGAVAQAWVPWLFEQLNLRNHEQVRKAGRLLAQLCAFLTLLFIIFSPEAIMILSFANPDFWVAKWVVPPVALGTLCQYFYGNYADVEQFYKKTPIIAVSTMLAAGINLVLNFIFIPRFGYVSAAYTTYVGYAFLMVFHFLAMRFVLREKIYDDKYMFGILLLTSLIGLSFMLMYEMYLPRYVFAVIFFGVLAFLKRRDIMYGIDLLKKRRAGKNQRR